jgi:nicotinamide riboside kinase
MKNIYIIGAQSTGKTTLVNAFEADLKETANENSSHRPRIIREIARTVLKEKHFSREDIATLSIRTLQLQQYILQAQFDAETTACPVNSSTWYISDRSGLDPIAYAKCYAGEDAAAEMLASEVWRELEDRMKKGIVILCEAGCLWLKDDGVRLMPKDRTEWTRVDSAFRDLLKTQGIEFFVISKDMDLQRRVEYVRKFFENAQEQTIIDN